MSGPLEIALKLIAAVATLSIIGGLILWRLQRPLDAYLRGCVRVIAGMCVIAVDTFLDATCRMKIDAFVDSSMCRTGYDGSVVGLIPFEG